MVASTSTLHGSEYLAYLKDQLLQELRQLHCEEVLFIPFARPGGISHDNYTEKVKNILEPSGIKVTGIHEYYDPIAALEKTPAIFTGGGNTFVLVEQLYQLDLMSTLRKRMYEGVFYLGTSAGSNICGLNMRTTNDMPIVMPPSFKTTGALGYNINAHYLDPIPGSTHMGETREQRIAEFHCYNRIPVVGLREGSYIRVQGDTEILIGPHQARVFRAGQPAIEVLPGYDFAQLSKST